MPAEPASPSLIDAVQKGDVATVREYMKAGVDPDSSDSMMRSALYHAASIGHTDIVNMLLARNADANFQDDDGETPFIAALAGGHFGVAKLLLDAGADINMISGEMGQTPLHWAFNMDLKDQKTARVIWLIDQGADANRMNGNGRSVLERAHDYESRWPYAAEILGHMQERIKSRDPAVIRARQMEAAKDELCAAIHGGLSDSVPVRPLRLMPKKL